MNAASWKYFASGVLLRTGKGVESKGQPDIIEAELFHSPEVRPDVLVNRIPALSHSQEVAVRPSVEAIPGATDMRWIFFAWSDPLA